MFKGASPLGGGGGGGEECLLNRVVISISGVEVVLERHLCGLA